MRRGLDYYGLMLHFLRIRHLSWALALLPLASWAQPASRPPARAAALPQAITEALNAELFYEVLLSELSTSAGDPGTGYALMLDAARRSDDSALYRRAVEIALQARSGDSALAAVRTWKNAQPQSRDANRFLLQILVALNRTGDTAEPLRQELAFKQALIDALPFPVFFKGTDGRYIGCNTRFAEVVGRDMADIVGHTIHDVFLHALSQCSAGETHDA